VVEYAKQYIAFLSSVPGLLLNGGSEALDKVQRELNPGSEGDRTHTKQDNSPDDLDQHDIYSMPQF
jgi:hypothetical protein